MCGTDTGVGKTIVTAALCARFQEEGIRTAAFKPVESGCRGGKHARRADTELLKKIGRLPESLDELNPYYFAEELAPGIAATRAGKKVSFPKISRALRALQKKYDLVLVEGAGGLLVPIAGSRTNLDLIRHLKVPVLLVARLGLGTINHTLLTLDCLNRHQIPVMGVILNQTQTAKSLAEKTNPAYLTKAGIPLLGVFPHLKGHQRKQFAQAAKQVKIQGL